MCISSLRHAVPVCAALLTAFTATASVPLGSSESGSSHPGVPKGRTLVSTVDVVAPIEVVWLALTEAEHLRAWMAPLVEMDLRVGGLMQANYNPDGAIGDESTIASRVLSFQPPRMISLKAERIPESFPFPKAVTESAWSVFILDELPSGATRVTCTGLGYGDDELTTSLMDFFRSGNEMLLGMLKRAAEEMVADGAAAAASTAAPIDAELRERWGPAARLIGEWRVDATWDDGRPLKARETHEWLHGGQFMVSRVHVTRPDGSEMQRYETISAPASLSARADADASKRSWRSWTFTFSGAVDESTFHAVDDDTLAYPPAGTPGGGAGQVRQQIRFDGDDAFVWTVWSGSEAAGWTRLIEARWERATP